MYRFMGCVSINIYIVANWQNGKNSPPHRLAAQPLGEGREGPDGAMRAEKGLSLFEKRDSPFREMGQPFSEKGIGVVGVFMGVVRGD